MADINYNNPSDAVKNFDYERYAVTRPNPLQHIPVKKYTRYVIDSRDRNTSLFPSPNSYDLILNETINEVTFVKLVKCDVPLSNYDVNEFNNILNASFGGGQVLSIPIPIGNYNSSINRTTHDTNTCYATDMDAFARTLTTAVATFNASFVCTYLPNTDSFKFTSSGTFSFNLSGPPAPYGMQGQTGIQASTNHPMAPDVIYITPYAIHSIGKILGFSAATYVSVYDSGNTLYTIVAPFRRNFQDNRYCVLNIDNMSINNSVNSNIFKSFALVDGRASADKVEKFFNPSIRLNKLRIEFIDYFGNPYNFRNFEHRIEILFESTSIPQFSRFTNV